MNESTAEAPSLQAARRALAAIGRQHEYLSLERLATEPGSVYLEACPALLRLASGMDFAFLAEPAGEDWSSMQTLVCEGPGGRLDPFRYELADTPCADVLRGRACCFPRAVSRLFPADLLLAELQVQSYVGLPILDDSGRPLGLFVALGLRPITEEHAQAVLAMQQLLARRLLVIFEHQRLQQEHRDLIEVGASATPQVFADLVQKLAKHLGVRQAFVLRPEGSEGLQVLASVRAGQPDPEFGFLRRETPFEVAFRKGEVFVPQRLPERYPHEPWLTVTGSEAVWARRLADRDGRFLGIFGIAHDRPLLPTLPHSTLLALFAERMRAELARLQAEEERLAAERRLLESRHHDHLSLLAGGIAHDFNNLLTGIVGQAEFARGACPPGGEADVHLERVVRTAERAGELCHHLLTYAGRRPLERVQIDLRRVVEEQVQHLDPALRAQVRVDLDVPQSALPVHVDPAQLGLAFSELLRNAAAERADSGPRRLHVVLEKVVLEAEDLLASFAGAALRPGPHARLRVFGAGAPRRADFETRLRDPFFTTKIRPRQGQGTGLGLAAVLGIARKHDAALRLLEDEGQELGLELLLPLAHGEPSDRGALRHRGPRGHARLLVVDDEDVVREVAALGLMRQGYDVQTAASGEEALAKLRAADATFDLLLVDFTMPGGLNGLEVLAQLRDEGCEVPVLLMSGLLQSQMLQRLSSYAHVAFLEKPFRNARLLESVASLLAR